MIEKLCVFCKNLRFGETTSYYESGGGTAEMSCMKHHFTEELLIGEPDEDFRRVIEFAKTCADYEQVKP